MNRDNLIMAFLLRRVAHLKQESERQPSTGYAQLQKWRLLEAQYILHGVEKLLGRSEQNNMQPTEIDDGNGGAA